MAMVRFAGWMRHDWLPDRQGLDGVFTLGWKFLDEPDDWSRRFGRFKDRNEAALYGSAGVFRVAFPELLEALGVHAARAAIVCALGSGDTAVNMEKPVPRLAKAVARLTGAAYVPEAITKSVHRPIHSVGGAIARTEELQKAAYRAGALEARIVFVFDDLVTRGGTLSKVAQALKAQNGDVTVYGVALAKHERKAYALTAKNDDMDPRWLVHWAAGEATFEQKQKAADV